MGVSVILLKETDFLIKVAVSVFCQCESALKEINWNNYLDLKKSIPEQF
jgi:hypothetical protein